MLYLGARTTYKLCINIFNKEHVIFYTGPWEPGVIEYYQIIYLLHYVSHKLMDLGATAKYKQFLGRYSITLLICYLDQWNQGNFHIHPNFTVSNVFYVSPN